MKPRTPRLRLVWPLLAATFLVTVAANPQCAQVDDRITAPEGAAVGAGSDNSGKSVADCVRACVEAAQQARVAEIRLHLERIADCHGSSTCRRDEATRHAAAMQEIAADERGCKALCHEQGGGSGGQ